MTAVEHDPEVQGEAGSAASRNATESLRRLAALTPSQRGVLQRLGDAGEPVTAAALAQESQMRTGSMREILDVLVTSGLVRRLRMPVTGPGRPSFGYEAVAPTDVAGALTVYVDVLAATATVLRATHPDPQGAAREIGRTWAEDMVGGALPDHRRHDDDAYADLVLEDHLDKIAFFFSALGFGAGVEDDRSRIVCRTCPFTRDGAVDPLLCDVHRGMTEQVVRLTARGQATGELRPWVTTKTCEVVLTGTKGP